MIQIYKPDNTNFDQNGDMPLLPEIATVHAVLNGEWEVDLSHPIDPEGRWKYIIEDAVVKMPSFNGDQLFRIKKKEKSDSGIEAELQPIFMDAKDDCFLLDAQLTEKTGQEALDIMTAPNAKYTGKSDIATINSSAYQTMNLIEAINGDTENSFINKWGGEILFDNFNVIINERIGSDHGVEIRYGKNMKEDGFSESVDLKDVKTRLIPKAYNGHMIDGDEPWVDSDNIHKYPTIRYGVMDFEDVKMRVDAQDDDEESGIIVCDSQEELNAALREKCREQYENGLDKPKVTISADMVMLEGTDLYQDVKELESVSLGDTVHCRHSKFDITTDARCIELKWDCVNKRVESVVIGDFQYNYIDNVNSVINRVEAAIRSDGSVIGQQVQGIINGVKAQLRAQSSIAKKSKVRATLFEDLDPESPTYGAMCLGTMGFEIASQRTADDKDWDWKTFGTGAGFFADFIVAGTMLADRIKGGTLILGGKDNGDGVAKVLDGSGNEVVRIDNYGISINNMGAGGLLLSNGNMYISNEDGDTTGILHYQDDGVSVQSYGGNNARMHLGNDGSFILEGTAGNIYGVSGGPLQINAAGELQISGKTTKTGKIEFSDGTYLTIQNGCIVGGNTEEGSF